MHINLSPEMEQFVQSKVDSGFYSNASDVIRDAIRRMREEDNKVEALRRALKAGDDDLDAGKGVPYTRGRSGSSASSGRDQHLRSLR